MADPAAPEKPDAPEENAPPDDKPAEKPEDDGIDWKAMARKHEREAKTNAARLKELEDRDKTETQKLTEERDGLKGNLTAAETKALRFEVALDKGVPKSLAVRLQGSTREEMEADADELMKTLGNGRKSPSFDGGAKDKDAPPGGSFLQQALADRKR